MILTWCFSAYLCHYWDATRWWLWSPHETRYELMICSWIEMHVLWPLGQVDLQSSEMDKGRLSVELQRSQSQTTVMDDMRREIQELSEKLARQTTPQNCSDDDLTVGANKQKKKLEMPCVLFKNKGATWRCLLQARCHTLASQLKEAEGKLRAEREETRDIRVRSEHLILELQQLRDQMAQLASSGEKAERTSGKLEVRNLELGPERARSHELRGLLPFLFSTASGSPGWRTCFWCLHAKNPSVSSS